jgi:predicted alpha/beta-hydrolase family hydrolase
MAAGDGIWTVPQGATCTYVLAHGAGAGMRHQFMETMCERLAARHVATYRYEFPYMEAGKKRPDSPRILQERVSDAVDVARRGSKLPLIAGGKSMGGRMTSLAAASEPLAGVNGLVFLGFPLHAPGKTGTARAEHLQAVDVPMLFIQGTRDSLADLELIRQVCASLGSRATLYIVEDGDHSFKVRKRSGFDPEATLDSIADRITSWSATIV